MATELHDGVWQLPCRGVNAYLVDDDVLTLVDAGTPWDERRLREGIADAGFAVDDVGRVLLTHYDLDHVGALAALSLDAPIYAHDPDAAYLERASKPPLSNHKGLLQRLVGWLASSPTGPVERVVDGTVLGSFRVFHTPGHTPGHVAYVSERHELGLLGDLVRAKGGSLKPSPWLLSYDRHAVTESIRRVAEEAPAFEVVAVGHGDPLKHGGSAALSGLL